MERLEIDFSKATLAAVVSVFAGITVSEYLDQLWQVMADDILEPARIFPIHVNLYMYE